MITSNNLMRMVLDAVKKAAKEFYPDSEDEETFWINVEEIKYNYSVAETDEDLEDPLIDAVVNIQRYKKDGANNFNFSFTLPLNMKVLNQDTLYGMVYCILLIKEGILKPLKEE